MTKVLVIDMLKGFLEKGYPLYCGDEARKIIPNVVSLLRCYNVENIIYLCDRHDVNDKEFAIFPPHCVKGTEEAEIIKELKPFPGRIIPKTRYSGFFNTSLEDELWGYYGNTTLIVVGVCTDICVMYTVADLRNRGYAVEILKSCVASFNKEAHNNALQHMDTILGAKIV